MVEAISSTAPALTGRSVASQRWSKAAFLHWRVSAGELDSLMPSGIRPDVHDGSSWVGLIAFYLDRARVFGSPPVPYFGSFAEVNVRLYGVDRRGRRGVVFRSLEASRLPSVLAARALFELPYFWSRTSLKERDGAIEYRSRRLGGSSRCLLTVRPGTRRVVDDPLADFVTARWGLFTSQRGKTIFLPNHHAPWPLFDATVTALDDTLIRDSGIADVSKNPPESVLYSPGVTTWFAGPR